MRRAARVPHVEIGRWRVWVGPIQVVPLAVPYRTVPRERRPLALQRRRRAPRRPSKGVREHPAAVPQHEQRIVAERRAMWRTFIHRSARHRMNSISSASRCALRVTAVVPSYSSTRRLTIKSRSRNSRVIGVPGYGVGCWMYGQSTCARANDRFAATDSRVSSGLPTISPPTTSIPCLCRMAIASSVAFPFRGPSPCWLFFARALRNTRSSSRTFSMPRNT